MTGIIWTYNIDAGNEKLEQIKKDYNRMRIDTIAYKKSKYGSTVSFENGDCWKVARPSYNQRCNKCNVAYIDRTIGKEVVDEVIFPNLISKPYTAYKYITLSPEVEDN